MKKFLTAMVAALCVCSLAIASEEDKTVWDIAPVGGSSTCKATRDTSGGPITIQADGFLSGGQAPVVSTSTGRVMIATGSCTNAQGTVSFGVTFGAAPKVFFTIANDVSLVTGATGVGTNGLISAVSITTSNFSLKTGIPAGGAVTNINWMAIGSD